MRKFDLYRMVNNKTPLSEEYFNPIWKDIDSRLDTLENVRVSWEEAVKTISNFGIKRIEELLRPSIEFLNEKKADAEQIVSEITTLRQNADAMINETRDDAIAAVNSAKTTALNEIESARQSALSQIQSIYTMSFIFGGD